MNFTHLFLLGLILGIYLNSYSSYSMDREHNDFELGESKINLRTGTCELPDRSEWLKLEKRVLDKLEFSPTITQKAFQNMKGLNQFSVFYDAMEVACKAENLPLKTAQDLIFEFFKVIYPTYAAFAEIKSLYFKPKIMPLESSYSLDTVKSYMTFYTPYLNTLQIMTGAFFTLLQKHQIVPDFGMEGTLPIPGKEGFELGYFKDQKGKWIPYFKPGQFDSKNLILLSLPWSVIHEPEYSHMAVLFEKGQVKRESGFFLKVDDRELLTVELVHGSQSRYPHTVNAKAHIGSIQDLKNPLIQAMSEIIGNDQLQPGMTEFIPFPDLTEQEYKLFDLILLEELLASPQEDDSTLSEGPLEERQFKQESWSTFLQSQPRLLTDSGRGLEDTTGTLQTQVNALQSNLMDEYQEQIAAEQKSRSEAVSTGTIYSRKDKQKARKKQKKKEKNKKSLSVNPEAKNQAPISTQKDLLKEKAKLLLEKEKGRIKKHRFLKLIRRCKSLLHGVAFDTLITRSGSHLTYHSDSKVSVTTTIPHKADGTLSKKIVKKFISEFLGFVEK